MTTTLITGANRGVGLALVQQCVERGHAVIATCRASCDELDATGARVETGIDVAAAESVAELARRLEGVSIDWLINNAGILSVERLPSLDFDAIRKQFEVNALGPLRVTEALLGNLAEGAKVALITSRMGSIDDNTSGGMFGYRMSKAALNMAGKSLSHFLKRRGVAVTSLHPGMVKTAMTRFAGPVLPIDAARGLLARIDELTLETTGEFRHANGETLPW